MPNALPIGIVVCGLLASVSAAHAASILTDDAPPSAASLGVRALPLPREATNVLDLPVPGVLVMSVFPGGPSAGVLQPRDILQQINAQILLNPPQLDALLQTLAPGQTVTVWRVRDGATQTVDVVLGTASALRDPRDHAADDVNSALAPAEPAWSADTRMPATLDAEQVTTVMNHIREAYETAILQGRLDDEKEALFMEEVRRRLEDTTLEPPTTNPDDYRRRTYAPHVPSGDRNTVTRGSGEGSVSVTERDGKQIITVRDANGVVLFEGPTAMQDGRSPLPPEVWKRYYNLERRGLVDATDEDAP